MERTNEMESREAVTALVWFLQVNIKAGDICLCPRALPEYSSQYNVLLIHFSLYVTSQGRFDHTSARIIWYSHHILMKRMLRPCEVALLLWLVISFNRTWVIDLGLHYAFFFWGGGGCLLVIVGIYRTWRGISGSNSGITDSFQAEWALQAPSLKNISWLNEQPSSTFSLKSSSVDVRRISRKCYSHIWGLEKVERGVSQLLLAMSVSKGVEKEPACRRERGVQSHDTLISELFGMCPERSELQETHLRVCVWASNLNFLRVSGFVPRCAHNLIHKTHNYKSDREVNEQCCAPLKDSQG